jgi:hypothetical protein
VAGQADPQTRPEDQRAKGDNANRRIARISRRQRHHQGGDFLQIVLGNVRHLQTKKIFYLHGTDSDTNTGGKPEGNG